MIDVRRLRRVHLLVEELKTEAHLLEAEAIGEAYVDAKRFAFEMRRIVDAKDKLCGQWGTIDTCALSSERGR